MVDDLLKEKKWSFQRVLEEPTPSLGVPTGTPAITLPKPKGEEVDTSLTGAIRDSFIGPFLNVEKAYYTLPMGEQLKTFFEATPRATFETFYNMGNSLMKLPFRVAQAIPGVDLEGKFPVTEKTITTLTKGTWRKFLDKIGKGWWVDRVEDFEIPPS